MVDRGAYVVFAGDVAVDEGGGRAETAADCGAELVLDVGDDDLGSVTAEELGGALADAAGSTGDEGNLTFQSAPVASTFRSTVLVVEPV